MPITLSKGTCKGLLTGKALSAPLVQIVQMTKFEEDGRPTQWLLEVSDGFASLPVMLSVGLNGLVESKKLRLRTIMEIKEHVCREYWGFRVVIIKAIAATGQFNRVIGHAKPLDVSCGTDEAELHVLAVLSSKPLRAVTVHMDDDAESLESFESDNMDVKDPLLDDLNNSQMGDDSSVEGSIGDVGVLPEREG
ncbi:hypothetical protein CALCODRAFT_489070 [Calocera cornea HHB12733]|uniref:Replication factor-A protein 1 N-terminal domain-containing protein n=1 Tax=Calocera cornea HHB12733 TaxID=1353952 RepID=A0A166MQ77_9BASI|nr:hypothetical protein CALCODRAFT_489070 [Calocera cornea HHB12733]